MNQCSDTTHAESEYTGDDGPCEHCGRRRCKGKAQHSDGKRCKNTPINGATVCVRHGGALPSIRRQAARNVVKDQIKDNVFWQGDAPLLDPGDALIRIASRLHATSEQLSMRLDRQVHDYEDRYADEGRPEACECCGHMPQEEMLDKGLIDLYKFTHKETANILTMIQKIGLAERAIRLQEAQALIVAQAMQTLFEHLNLPEHAQIEARQVVLNKMMELEEAPGPTDDPVSAVEVIAGDVLEGPVEPSEDLEWLS